MHLIMKLSLAAIALAVVSSPAISQNNAREKSSCKSIQQKARVGTALTEGEKTALVDCHITGQLSLEFHGGKGNSMRIGTSSPIAPISKVR